MPEPLTAAEANRIHYGRIAESYDATEGCVVDERLRSRLRQSIEIALEAVGRRDDLRVLDACGGSGNASLMLFDAGCRPRTLDISEEMIALYRAKAASRGFEADTVVASVEEHLAADPTAWDLIVLSSALHHLDDPEGVVRAAVGHLASGGCLVTAFDPRRLGALPRLVRRLDYYLHVLVRHPGEARAKLRARAGRPAAGDHVGAMAERHAVTGLADDGLRAAAEEAGAVVLQHDLYYEGRFALTRGLLRLARTPTTFGFVLQRR